MDRTPKDNTVTDRDYSTLVEHQFGIYVALNNLSIADADNDTPEADTTYQQACQAATRAAELLRQLPCWTKSVPDGNFTFTLNPYELCEFEGVAEDIEGKAGFTLWIHCDREIPLEDLRAMRLALLQAFQEVAGTDSVEYLKTEQMHKYSKTVFSVVEGL